MQELQEETSQTIETAQTICDACTTQQKCRRYASNTRFHTKVTNCRPPQFNWNGKPVEGLFCKYEPKRKEVANNENGSDNTTNRSK